jgi:microcompartment protein CcmK/EutM
VLPLLVLGQQYEKNPELRRAWESYLDNVRAGLPTLPLIDGGAAVRFLREHAQSMDATGAAVATLRDDSIAAGFTELVARLRAVLVGGAAER